MCSLFKDYPQFIADISFRIRVKAVLEALKLKDDDFVLDCGCGDAVLDPIIEKKCSGVIGIDLYYFNIRATNRFKGNVAFILADIAHLPFRAGTFNKALCMEVLEHLHDDIEALREIKRVLVRGGILVITVPNLEYPFLWDPINAILTRLLRTRPIYNGLFGGIWFDHKRLYRSDELKKVLNLAGFQVVDIFGLNNLFLPFQPLIWNLYVVLQRKIRKIIHPPRSISKIIDYMDRKNRPTKKISSQTTLLAHAHVA